jgi:hypothetical protein
MASSLVCLQGLLNAIMELMEEEEILDENINEFLKEDLSLARRDLADVATLRASQVRVRPPQILDKNGARSIVYPCRASLNWPEM